jgi:hypothetical protein
MGHLKLQEIVARWWILSGPRWWKAWSRELSQRSTTRSFSYPWWFQRASFLNAWKTDRGGGFCEVHRVAKLCKVLDKKLLESMDSYRHPRKIIAPLPRLNLTDFNQISQSSSVVVWQIKTIYFFPRSQAIRLFRWKCGTRFLGVRFRKKKSRRNIFIHGQRRAATTASTPCSIWLYGTSSDLKNQRIMDSVMKKSSRNPARPMKKQWMQL